MPHAFSRHALLPAALALLSLSAQAVDCGMNPAFRQKDGNAKGGTTAVWAAPDQGTLLFVEGLNVNTDGTRRSYSVDDFWGETKALNNLCNAMRDGCAGLDAAGKRARRIATQNAAAAGWPADQLAQTRIASAIIPFRHGKPCPAVDGFLVSATALARPHIDDQCDIANYLDALTVPAIVLPKNPAKGVPSEFVRRNARIGDLVVTLVPGAAAPVYAVVGDTGPAGELGEGSIALNGQLLGKTRPPANYQEVRGKGPYAGRGWTVPKAAVLIFPGSRDEAEPFMGVDRIDAAARQRFDAWGGVERLNACIAAYPQNAK